MAQPSARTHRLRNGLTLVTEQVPEVRSVSFQILIPAGAVTEPDDQPGITGVLENMCYRGAGDRDARELSDALDNLGIQRGGAADLESTGFSGTLLADDLAEALEIYASIIRHPALPDDQLEGARQLALQRLVSLEDNPAQKLFVELLRLYFPGPYGRSPLGTAEGLEAINPASLRSDHAARFRPADAILAVAGRFDWDALVQLTERLFGDWEGSGPPTPPVGKPATGEYRHISDESAQEQIGIAWPDVTVDHPSFYASRLGVQVLSGGTSARLFTEVREKRGLVYSVSAFPRAVRGAGMILAYAGTTPERRQECLDVLLGELRRLALGVEWEELERARVGLLSTLVMQGESSGARAGAIARDQFILGRVRSLNEIRQQVEGVTVEAIASHLQAFPPRDFTVMTLGPEPVEVCR